MLKTIHLKALMVWGLYSVLTKGSFLTGFVKTFGVTNAYLINVIFGALFGVVFLYIFSHEDFFKFAKEIERKNVRKEQKWIKRFKHLGSLLSSLAITVFTGPLIGALAVRFLLARYQYRYIFIGLSSALSATIWLGVARGLIPWNLPF